MHIASARLIGRPALTGLALAHGYDTAFWWIAGIFLFGSIVGGTLLRPGPLYRKDSQARRTPGSWRPRQGPPSPRDAAVIRRASPLRSAAE